MRRLLLCSVVVLAVAAAFALGRGTADTKRASSPVEPRSRLFGKISPANHVYALRSNDVVIAPAAKMECVASHEAGFPNLLCSHVPAGRYSVAFYTDSFLVFRGPDNVVFNADWRR
jgi:hypothetical protein